MTPKIDHLSITVRDLALSEDFYNRLLPILGFDLAHKSKGSVPAHQFEAVEYTHPQLVFGINTPRASVRDDPVHRRRPGSLHHLAFRAASPAEIDALCPRIRDAGARIVEPPRYYTEHGDAYYALFFKDPDSIKLEVMHEDRELK